MKVLKLSYMTVLRNVNNTFTVLYDKYLLKGSETHLYEQFTLNKCLSYDTSKIQVTFAEDFKVPYITH